MDQLTKDENNWWDRVGHQESVKKKHAQVIP